MSHSQDAESTHGSGDDDSYTYYSSYTPFSDRSEDERSEEERSEERPPKRQRTHNSEVSESSKEEEEASPKESASYSARKSEEWEAPACKGRLQKAKEMVAQAMKILESAEKAQAQEKEESEARRQMGPRAQQRETREEAP